jgi:enamine deaminase RidA (YjgF/YER057c/UK114 family)
MRIDGQPAARGKVGRDLSTEDGYKVAREVGVNLLGTARTLLGSLDKVKRIVKVLGMVNSAEGFGDQPKVINGFSDLMVEVFGENGRHARSAVGMAELPSGIPVEIEMILEVE